jgi:hypothetical protein
MAIDYDRLMNWRLPPVRQTLGKKDCILYALGVGLGADPLDAAPAMPGLTSGATRSYYRSSYVSKSISAVASFCG